MRATERLCDRNEKAPCGRLVLDDSCLLEGGVGTVFLDVTEALYRDVDQEGLSEFSDVNTALLEVSLATYLAGWVELRCTGTVRIPPANLRALASDFTFACHSRRMLA